MAEVNAVYEIMQMMQDKGNVRQDMNNAVNMVASMFKDKYITRMNDAVREHHTKLTSDPPREVRLMQALKPFMPEQNQTAVDSFIDVFLTMSTISSIRTGMGPQMPARPAGMSPMPNSSAIPGGYPDSSVHADGVYDIDRSCAMNKKSPANMMMPLMLMMALCTPGKIN